MATITHAKLHLSVEEVKARMDTDPRPKLGVSSVETAGKGGRRRSYLTLEEEQDFLRPFFERAERGPIATTAHIQQAFEQKVGHEVDSSTIYRLLDRHGWRKLVPRSFHPQANKEEQEQFQQEFPERVQEIIRTRDPIDERPVLKLAPHASPFWLDQRSSPFLGTQTSQATCREKNSS